MCQIRGEYCAYQGPCYFINSRTEEFSAFYDPVTVSQAKYVDKNLIL